MSVTCDDEPHGKNFRLKLRCSMREGEIESEREREREADMNTSTCVLPEAKTARLDEKAS